MNPIAITTQALPGRQLPPGWKPEITTSTFDQRDLANIEPRWSTKLSAENLQRDSRLSPHPSWGDLLGQR
jgi:hypothetical protein